jgi:hypothetical protein
MMIKRFTIYSIGDNRGIVNFFTPFSGLFLKRGDFFLAYLNIITYDKRNARDPTGVFKNIHSLFLSKPERFQKNFTTVVFPTGVHKRLAWELR